MNLLRLLRMFRFYRSYLPARTSAKLAWRYVYG